MASERTSHLTNLDPTSLGEEKEEKRGRKNRRKEERGKEGEGFKERDSLHYL